MAHNMAVTGNFVIIAAPIFLHLEPYIDDLTQDYSISSASEMEYYSLAISHRHVGHGDITVWKRCYIASPLWGETIGGFPLRKSVIKSFDVVPVLKFCLNNPLNKQQKCRWAEMQWLSYIMWRRHETSIQVLTEQNLLPVNLTVLLLECIKGLVKCYAR